MLSEEPMLMIVEFILAFGFLVFLHEFGHFITARIFGIEVEEFGFGFPPRLAKLGVWKGTEITLNWIPFGAFVRPKGENDPTILGGMAAANPWKRLGILLGGPVMNLLTGIILFSIVFSQTGVPDFSQVQVVDVNANSPAEQAGILPGDLIISVNDQKVTSIENLAAIISANAGTEISLQYLRDEQTFNVTAIPRVNPPAGEGSFGISMTNPVIKAGFTKTVPFAFRMTYEQGKQLLLLPGRLIRGEISGEEARFVGPVGAYGLYEQAREMDEEMATAPQEAPLPAVNTLWLMGLLAVALGLTNLLPLPALDGGRIAFLLPELVTGKRVPAEFENLVNLVGFFALIALMIYITAQDILNPINLP